MSAEPTSQPPYLFASQVASMFTQTSTFADLDSVRRLFAPHCDGHVMGQDHHLSGPRSGGESWVQHLEAMAAIFDKEAYRVETVNAFGGEEEPWVCWEAVITAKTKEGESLISTLVYCFYTLPPFSLPPLPSFLEEEGE